MPTPNDTRTKQFFTALAMTILFSLGVAVSWGLWLLYNHLLASSTEWVQWCGIAVRIGFWVNNLIIVVVSLLSMLDWMRATCGRYI